MNFSAQLSAVEVECLSDPDRTYSDATAEVERIDTSARGTVDEGSFETSLKIKNTLDAFEASARSAPSWSVMALLANCEHRLWNLNAGTPMRQNPFLTHWVEAFQRSDKEGAARAQAPSRNTSSSGTREITVGEIFKVRAEWIKCLLLSKDVGEFSHSTPRQLYHALVNRVSKKPFDITLYVHMLEDEGVYDKTPEPQAPSRQQRKDEQHRNNASQQWKEDMAWKLEEQPDAALQELSHLPLELSSLDFLTTLLTNRTLESYAIDPAPVVTSYIQHALRLTEQMGEPPGMSSQDTLNADSEASGHADRSGVREYGKEAQGRAVRLLLLFIKSLIRKQLLGIQVLYFEIQEICVRYVWIKEVRDFRVWVEEGVGDELVEQFGGG